MVPSGWYVDYVLLPPFPTLIITLAPVNISQAIWGPDAEAWDALAHILNECCVNDMFCTYLLNDHGIIPNHNVVNGQQNVILTHLLTGMCAHSSSSPSCKLIAQESPSITYLSYTLCMLLLGAYKNKQVNIHNFMLCCAAVDMYPSTNNPGRELKSKLNQSLKVRKPVIACVDVFATINSYINLGLVHLLYLLHSMISNLFLQERILDVT